MIEQTLQGYTMYESFSYVHVMLSMHCIQCITIDAKQCITIHTESRVLSVWLIRDCSVCTVQLYKSSCCCTIGDPGECLLLALTPWDLSRLSGNTVAIMPPACHRCLKRAVCMLVVLHIQYSNTWTTNLGLHSRQLIADSSLQTANPRQFLGQQT